MKWKSIRIPVALALCLTFYQPLTWPRPAAAQDDSQERDIESTEALRGRRQGKSQQSGRDMRYRGKQLTPPKRTEQAANRKSPAGQTAQTPKATAEADAQQFPVGPPPKGKTYLTLGVTLWRIRPATEAEKKDPNVSTEVMEWDKRKHEVVVTRISDDSPVEDGDLIQISIEYLPDPDGADAMPLNRAGYLYVVNREEFSGANLKNARLIFPTRLTYQGDNRLLPGKTVTLPDPARPFRIKRGDDAGRPQEYETYTLILSPDPLKSELPQELDRKAMVLPPDLVPKWEQRWNPSEARADLLGGVGQPRTQRELRASGDIDEERGSEDTAEDLTQDDPPPQTLFRRVVEPGATLIVTIRLPFKKLPPGREATQGKGGLLSRESRLARPCWPGHSP